MQNKHYGKQRLFGSLAGLAFLSLVAFSSCDKEESDSTPKSAKYSISGAAAGSQEVPAVTTSATGNLSGSYDTTSKSLIYTVTWTGLSGEATMAHFHGPALAGAIAPPMETLTITANGTAGTATDTITATSALHAALLAGQVYYNIHTAAHPDGEIRGQIAVAQQSR